MTNVNDAETSDDFKNDIPLDVDMSFLELDEKGLNETQSETVLETSSSDNSNNLRRSKRKRFRPAVCDKRRITLKPSKIIDGNYKETINYYLDKRVKKLPSTLETIFEEPKSGVIMSNRRLKRFINFYESPLNSKDKVKIKKRSMKAKKVHPMKKFKKVSMDLLMQKLMNIEQ